LLRTCFALVTNNNQFNKGTHIPGHFN